MGLLCSGCGGCCRRAAMVPDLVARGFPRPDGTCRHLTPTSRCAIYATRPSVCRADDQRPETMDPTAWARGNHVVCNLLMEIDGVDPSLRIPVEEMYPEAAPST